MWWRGGLVVAAVLAGACSAPDPASLRAFDGPPRPAVDARVVDARPREQPPTPDAAMLDQALAPPDAPAPPPRVFWSFGYYTGWSRWSPAELDFTPWTHVIHFAMAPTPTGGLLLGDVESDAQARALVHEAHAHGRAAVLAVGGYGDGEAFLAATGSEHRAQLVAAIAARVKAFAYDGVLVDWEDHVDGAQLGLLVQDLRAALSAQSPTALLAICVASDAVPPAATAALAQWIDSANIMSYGDDGQSEVQAYLGAGVPAAKIVVGISFEPDAFDSTAARVQDKIDLVAQRGLRGTEVWAVDDLASWSDPRLDPLRQAVAANP